jgi:dihydroorotase
VRECSASRRDFKGLAGEELAPIGSLAQAGVVAITDDGHCIQNNELMRRAVEYARWSAYR